MKKDKKALSKIKFERDAAGYDQSPEYASGRSRYQYVIDEALKYPFHTWLDIGCGTGALLARFAEQSNSVRSDSSGRISPMK
jgi:ubiquinone/menaquinone biosynthesis C-methylase UbiE